MKNSKLKFRTKPGIVGYAIFAALFNFLRFGKSKKDRADYIPSDSEMIDNLIDVSRKQTEKVKNLAKELKQKVLNKQDTEEDWYNFKNEEKIQNMYLCELIKISAKRSD